jgi:hypothetical protein
MAEVYEYDTTGRAVCGEVTVLYCASEVVASISGNCHGGRPGHPPTYTAPEEAQID